MFRSVPVGVGKVKSLTVRSLSMASFDETSNLSGKGKLGFSLATSMRAFAKAFVESLFMICPTKNMSEASLPALYSATTFGFASMCF